MTTAAASRKGRNPKVGHDRLSEMPLSQIDPSPENDELYRTIDASDPDILALRDSIREHGILEPLDVTLDGDILSGHRRYMAARLAGLKTVPVRIEPIRRADDPARFVVLLREHNRQRDKSRDERLREELVTSNPDEAYESLIEHRRTKARVDADTLNIGAVKERKRISDAKAPMLAAIKNVLDERSEFLPLSGRQIHYALLNDPPLKHASKPGSQYDNTKQSYKSLIDLLTRARLDGQIPMHAISDETRPVVIWTVHREPGSFIRRELDDFLKGYWRDLMQSQPNHVELIVEKNTVASIIRPVAMQYCIPMTSGRGFCSLPPRRDMDLRFERSGKRQLVMLFVTDFDPDGEQIAQSYARSMRDDFDLDQIVPIKIALTAEQVDGYKLPPGGQAKKDSTNYHKFVERYGEDVFELEALQPSELQKITRAAIDSVLDLDAFNAELDAEKKDAAFLDRVRRTVHAALKDLRLTDTEDPPRT